MGIVIALVSLMLTAIPQLTFVRDGWISDTNGRLARGDAPTWSRDGKLAFVRDRWIHVASFGRIARGEAPAWSPDGTRLAFGRDGEIFTIDADGRNLRRVTRRNARWNEDRSPSWTPDGARLVFGSNRAGVFNQELYAVGASGGPLTRLTHTAGSETMPGDDGMPSVSPDGTQVAFVSNRDRRFELYTARIDGSGQDRLTHTPRVDEALPRWSPDGQAIAYEATAAGDGASIWVYTIATSSFRRVGPGTAPAWRP